MKLIPKVKDRLNDRLKDAQVNLQMILANVVDTEHREAIN